MRKTGIGLFWRRKQSELRYLCSLKKVVPEELRHAAHSVQLCRAPEHMSLIRIDFNLIGDLMLLQNALKFMRAINRHGCVLGSVENQHWRKITGILYEWLRQAAKQFCHGGDPRILRGQCQ